MIYYYVLILSADFDYVDSNLVAISAMCFLQRCSQLLSEFYRGSWPQSTRGAKRGTSYPGPVRTGALEDESTHGTFFCNQAQNY